MAKLADLSADQKRVNFVWIGTGSINCLSAFNILSWVACGWTVTIYKHPLAEEATVASLFVEGAREAIADVPGINVVSLVSAIQSTEAMPNARRMLEKWIGEMGVGYTSYAVGDLTKSFLGGTRVGIVIDLKVGPSKWIFDYPAEPFTESFVSYTRKTSGVENQCMGSFNLDVSRAYGEAFDGSVNSRLGGVVFEQMTDAQAAFASITSMHQKAFSTIKGKDVRVLDEARWKFPELSIDSAGPFHVYQKPGFFNWYQGEYPDAKLANDAAVARELEGDHPAKRVAVRPPFTNDDFYKTRIKPMALKAIAALKG